LGTGNGAGATGTNDSSEGISSENAGGTGNGSTVDSDNGTQIKEQYHWRYWYQQLQWSYQLFDDDDEGIQHWWWWSSYIDGARYWHSQVVGMEFLALAMMMEVWALIVVEVLTLVVGFSHRQCWRY